MVEASVMAWLPTCLNRVPGLSSEVPESPELGLGNWAVKKLFSDFEDQSG